MVTYGVIVDEGESGIADEMVLVMYPVFIDSTAEAGYTYKVSCPEHPEQEVRFGVFNRKELTNAV